MMIPYAVIPKLTGISGPPQPLFQLIQAPLTWIVQNLISCTHLAGYHTISDGSTQIL